MGLQRAMTTGLAARLFGPEPAKSLALLRAAWPLAVGPEIARRTEVLAVEGKSLRIHVPDAGWRKVLHRMQREILTRLREIAGELAPRRLGFSEGLIPSAPIAEVNVTPTDAPGRDLPSVPPSVAAEAQAIVDPDMRARFLETAARYLNRTRSRTS